MKSEDAVTESSSYFTKHWNKRQQIFTTLTAPSSFMLQELLTKLSAIAPLLLIPGTLQT